jgi:cobalt-zinc-cadmium efflux system membrane fusion protein
MNRIFYPSIRILLLSFLLVILWACTAEKADSPDFSQEATADHLVLSDKQKERISIAIASVKEELIQDKLPFRGFIEVPPENLHTLHAPMKGIITWAPLIEGDKVSTGQALLKLRHPDILNLQEDYLKVLAQLAFLHRELERQELLLSKDATGSKQVDEVRREIKLQTSSKSSLEARLKQLGIQPEKVLDVGVVDEITIRSPAKGSITSIGYNAGKLMAEDEFLLEIVDKEHLHLAIDIFENEVYRLKKDQLIEFYLPGDRERAHFAELVLIGQMVDANKRTVLIHAHPQEDLDIFIPGMQISGLILLEENRLRAIPSTAVFEWEGRSIVFVPQDDHFRVEVIEVDRVSGGFHVLSEGYTLSTYVAEGAWYLFGVLNQ